MLSINNQVDFFQIKLILIALNQEMELKMLIISREKFSLYRFTNMKVDFILVVEVQVILVLEKENITRSMFL